MPINIADQFKVNVSLPVDSRIVASGSTARSAIQFKYDGLRVFDTSNRTTYIWNATTSTFSVADIIGTGDTNYMTRWSSSTGLTSSGIYYAVGSSINKGNVGINTSSPQSVLQINSDSGTSQPFVIHKGASTLLAYNFSNSGSDSYFSAGVGSAAIRFIDDGAIDFLTRSVGDVAINSTNDANLAFRIQSGAGWAYLFKNLILSGNTTTPTTSLFLRSQNAFSTAAFPDVTWYNNDNTGIFHPANSQIGFSIQGTQRARLTSTGLLLGGNGTGSPITPFNKLHLDNGNGVASYLQFTAGTTTGTGASDGFLVGINSSGYPVLQSYDNFPISTTFGGKHQHKLDLNSFTIYSDTGGVGFNDISGFTGKRVTRVTKSASITSSGAQNLLITGFSVPASSMCSLEITFVTALKITSGVSSGTFQYKTQKLLISFSVASVALLGAITPQNTGAALPAGGTGNGNTLESHDIKTLTSSSATNIGKGFLTYFPGNSGNGYAAFVNISQQLNIVAPAISYTATVVIDYKLIVNQHGL